MFKRLQRVVWVKIAGGRFQALTLGEMGKVISSTTDSDEMLGKSVKPHLELDIGLMAAHQVRSVPNNFGPAEASGDRTDEMPKVF